MSAQNARNSLPIGESSPGRSWDGGPASPRPDLGSGAWLGKSGDGGTPADPGRPPATARRRTTFSVASPSRNWGADKELGRGQVNRREASPAGSLDGKSGFYRP